MRSIDYDIGMSRSAHDHGGCAGRSLILRLESFAWDAIDEEAKRAGLTTEELVAFSVLYYLADVDSGRISRRISRSPYPPLPADCSRAQGADRDAPNVSGQPISERG